MARHARAPAGTWFSTGAALTGLAGIVVYVATGASSWPSFALTAFAIVVTALVLARASVALPDGAVAGPASSCRRAAPVPLLGAAVLASVATAIAADSRIERGFTNSDIVEMWLISIALFLLAAWWRPIESVLRRALAGSLALPRPALPAVAAWAGITALALAPRVVWLDRYTTVMDGDEGSFMVQARLAQQGALPDVFGPGFYGNPNLYPATAGWLAGFIGSPPYDYRIMSAIVGTIGVVAAWRLGRYVVGPAAAAVGAIILATMPFHLQFSRSALNNIGDAAVLAVALLFLLRGVMSGRAGDAALVGVALGFGLYGYFGARAFPAVLLVSLGGLVLSRRVGVQAAMRLAAWVMAGIMVTALPLIMAYRDEPAGFVNRMDQLSPFTRERFREESAGTIVLFLESLRDGVLYPLIGNNQGFYRHPPPYIGWWVAILLTIGVAVWLARWARRRDPVAIVVLLVPWMLLTAGAALTTPIQGQRLIALSPLFALAAGSGLVAVAAWLARVARPRIPHLDRVLIAMVLVAIGVTELRWYASEDRQIANYGDYRGTMMWDIGWRVDHAAPGSGEPPRVLFAGPPHVFTGGFNNLVIQAPELDMTDVAEPLGSMPTPVLADGSMLIIVGERQTERCVAEAIYPSASVAETHARDGTLLYIALYREPLEGWSTDATPAETAFTVVTESPCES